MGNPFRYEQRVDNTNLGENLIFLISLPRSGSTLLQKILNNHSEISTTGEAWMCLPLFYGNPLDNFRINPRVRYGANSAEVAIRHSLNELPECEDRLKLHLSRFYEGIAKDHAASQNARYFLDKTPRYYLIVEELIKLYPKSKFIVLHRNPVAVLASILKTWVKRAPFMLSFYKDDLSLGLEQMSRLKNQKGANFFHINYEDLIQDPQKHGKDLFAFLSLKFESDILNLEKKYNWKFGDPVNAQKKETVDRSNQDSWKKAQTVQHNRFTRDFINQLPKEILDSYNLDRAELMKHFKTTGYKSVTSLFTYSFSFSTSIFAELLVPFIRYRRALIKKIRLAFK